MIRLVGLSGYRLSGKTEVAKLMDARNGYVRLSFADPLKRMLKALGLSDRHLYGDLKEKPTELLCGASPRHAMQTLGTEWGRHLIHPDLWVSRWKGFASTALAIPTVNVVADDVRLPNEARSVRDLGGVVIRIDRPCLPPPDAHVSESGVASLCVDHVVVNDGTLEDLLQKIMDIVS